MVQEEANPHDQREKVGYARTKQELQLHSEAREKSKRAKVQRFTQGSLV